jgi:hypothetical protein
MASNGASAIINEMLTNTPTNAINVVYEITLTANGCTNTQNVTVSVYGKLSAGAIGSDQTICNGETPAKLTSLSLASGGNGTTTYEWQYSIDDGTTWQYTSNIDPQEYSPPALTQTTQYRRMANNACGIESTDPVTITVRHPSLYNYPDLRIRVCPDAGTSINLSKYVDTLELTTGFPQWQSLSGVPITSGGVISANNLSASPRVHTFAYTVSNSCIPGGVTRKAYLEVLQFGRMHPLQDTIVICSDYAEAVNINQIFGIDAQGTWSYKSWTTGDVDAYVTESHSPEYGGAVVMNGYALYKSNITPYKYHGVDTKQVVFTYTPGINSCLKEKSYTVVIILTGS